MPINLRPKTLLISILLFSSISFTLSLSLLFCLAFSLSLFLLPLFLFLSLSLSLSLCPSVCLSFFAYSLTFFRSFILFGLSFSILPVFIAFYIILINGTVTNSQSVSLCASTYLSKFSVDFTEFVLCRLFISLSLLIYLSMCLVTS